VHVFAVVTALFVASAAAQVGPQPDIGAQMKCASALLNRGEYLKAVDFLAAARANEPDAFGPLHQFSDQVMPFVTGGPAYPQRSKPNLRDLRRLSRAELHDAMAEIVRRARQTNVVILNEEHKSPRDRAFALKVAQALRPLGYSVLAAEAFASSSDPLEIERRMQELAAAGYPSLQSGLYTKDPVFADFVRHSLALGYRPVAYEYVSAEGAPPPADPIAARNQGEADNLVREVFAKAPAAKVLIYVGYSHAAEQAVSGNEWMASRLKRMTRIDPLTIDQTSLSPSAFDGRDRGLYAALKGRMHRRSVVPVLRGKPLKIGSMAGSVDLLVAHPPSSLVTGRADWLRDLGRTPLEVPRQLLPRGGRVLVQAFFEDDGADAVPLDQVVVSAGGKPPALMVPPGRLRFVVRKPFEPGDCDSLVSPPTAR